MSQTPDDEDNNPLPPDEGHRGREHEPEQSPDAPRGLEKEKKKPGCFTPLNVIAFSSIVLVLGAILIPNFVRARARGQLTACKSNLKNIGTALEMYSTDWSGKYPKSLDALTPKYLKTIPECPSAGSNCYVASFGPKAPYNEGEYEDYYFIECVGENHTDVSVTGNFPAYNGIQGLIERDPGTPRAAGAPGKEKPVNAP